MDSNKLFSLNAVQISGRDNIHISPELDRYAFMNSKLYESLMTHKMREGVGDDLYCYVKVSYENNKPIYLKYRSIPSAQKNQIFLTYINLCRLGVLTEEETRKRAIEAENSGTEIPIKLKIEKTNWFRFNWNGGDKGEKKLFRWTFLAFVIGFLAIITDLIFNIIKL